MFSGTYHVVSGVFSGMFHGRLDVRVELLDRVQHLRAYNYHGRNAWRLADNVNRSMQRGSSHIPDLVSGRPLFLTLLGLGATLALLITTVVVVGTVTHRLAPFPTLIKTTLAGCRRTSMC
jgi:hypothetical protein